MEQDPANFLFNLADQIQLLVCLAWVGKTQTLACIGPSDEVAFEDIAETVGVPTDKLARVIRWLAAAGFFHEPRRRCVAHTPLSLQFFQRPSLMDAALFLSDTMIPAAMHMVEPGVINSSHGTVSWINGQEFGGLRLPQNHQQPRLRRQMEAFHHLANSKLEATTIEALLSLDWQGLGHATVVQVRPPSLAIAQALSQRASQLSFIVQSKNQLMRSDWHNEPRIQTQSWNGPECQTVIDADVYLLHLSSSIVISATESCKASIAVQLQAHFNVLRSNNKASLVIVALVLPNVEDRTAETESFARLHDIMLLQHTDGRAMDVDELEALIRSIGDEKDSLTVINKLSPSLRQHSVTVLEAEIQAKNSP